MSFFSLRVLKQIRLVLGCVENDVLQVNAKYSFQFAAIFKPYQLCTLLHLSSLSSILSCESRMSVDKRSSTVAIFWSPRRFLAKFVSDSAS